MISFRVSDEEYQQLSETCVATNARSLSDVAREAVHFWMENTTAAEDNSLAGRLRSLEDKVEQLTSELDRLGGATNGNGTQ